ncbi:MAG: hypothetical protein BIP78_1481 [Candidatus Bipolaricaulis sibiricus]|uniref:PorV/PorQ family protein n=1 Tax=Bipolaricaulis sibiricus TaxID=2501609 RepID=A0A410FVY9_BIPS1|nr:MAG: hypothetical protein BIP78_1481 [Candidatus Bipolaricaulis sibiricus]
MRKLAVAVMLVSVLGMIGLGYEGSIVFQGGHGAKALGMAGAFCALANDGTAALWNPAGIALMGHDIWLGGATSNLFGMVGYQYIAGGYKFGDYAVGLAWSNATAGTQYGANLYLGTVGVKIGDFGTVGANVKYYQETIAGSTASGFGFDLGLLVPLTPEIAIGVVAKDVGGTTIANQTVTSVYGAGMGLKLLDGALVLAADVALDGAFQPLNLGAGLEFVLIENLAVRAGVAVPKIQFADYYFSVGAGFAIAGLTIDAAYVLKSEPGETLVLSATFAFGELFAPTTPEPGPTR